MPGESTNFLVAGMLPDTQYLMRNVLNTGAISTPILFRTGSLPTNISFPTASVPMGPQPGTDLTQNMILHGGILGPTNGVTTYATDLNGNITWYYDSIANNFSSYFTSLEPGGDMLLIGGDANETGDAGEYLREIDLAGDTVRETNINAINAQLAILGQQPVFNFNHDVELLPNGDLAVLANTQRIINVAGTPTVYNGDMVLVLDKNLQIVWDWDPFLWLDTNRLPTLGEGPTNWLHANAIAWSPEDGDLLISLRSQDWVIKIDYDNGNGDGHIVWTLGLGGDFQYRFRRTRRHGSPISTMCGISTTTRLCSSMTATFEKRPDPTAG